MKKALVAVGACALAIALTVGTYVKVSAQTADPEGEKGMVVGTIVELTTYAMTGDYTEHVDAAKARAEEGFPVAIIEEETNAVWILAYRNAAPASHLEVPNKRVGEFIGQMAVVQGLKYTKNDVNVIRFSVIAEY